MPFPSKKPAAQATAPVAPAAPAFTKKAARKRKTRKAAPIQKAMMQSGRALGGGGR